MSEGAVTPEHVADVTQIALCPVMYQAKCRCGKWDKVRRTVDELRTEFESHKKAQASA